MSMPTDEVTKLIHNLNSLTYGSWNETSSSQNYGQSVSLALSFIDPQTGLPSYYNSLPPNISATLAAAFGQGFNTGVALNAVAQQQVTTAFNAWAKFANISLLPSPPVDQTNTITVAMINITGTQRDADAVTLVRPIASSNTSLPIWGDMWLNSNSTKISSGNFAVGSYGYEALLHEIGHALGLKHPVQQDSGGGDEPPFFNENKWNSTQYTVMSYRRFGSYVSVAPGILDIAAIQRLYGANATTNAGSGDTYQFTLNNGWPIQAIWDAGGANDVIDGGNQSRELVIDLNPGGRSYGRYVAGAEIHIAYTPVGTDGVTLDANYINNYIEDANGGSDDDTIIGNQGNNILRGNGGNDELLGEKDADKRNGTSAASSDQLIGGAGDDELYGGRGFDTYVYSSGDGKDTIFDLGGEGEIQVNGVALSTLQFTLTRHPQYTNRRAWRAEINGAEVFIVEWSGAIENGDAELRIQGAALGGTKDFITVEDFAQGELGLTLDTVNRVVLIEQPGTLQEGNAVDVGFDLNAAAAENQRVRVSVSAAFASQLRFVTGAETLAFNSDGTLNVQLAAGQSEFRYSLVSFGDVDANGQIDFSVALLDANGQVIAGSQDATTIEFEAVEEPDAEPPVAFPNTGLGTEQDDQLHNLQNEYVAGAPIRVQAFGGNDRIRYDSDVHYESDLVIEAGNGSDYVIAESKNIWVQGGAGNDLLTAYGAGTLLGGDGSDILFSGADPRSSIGDRLVGNVEMTLEQAIALGETEEGSIATGDLLSSADPASNDLLIGTSARDVLAGGGGTDTMVGGAGDDLILGDRYVGLQFIRTDWLWYTIEWDWSKQLTVGEDGALTFSYTFTDSVQYTVWENGAPLTSTGNFREISLPGAADVIYAGAGDDAVLADEGDDFVDAGSGNDIVFGGVGNDRLFGGDGDDLLQAGDASDVGDADFVDGGAGNDDIWGGHGSDVLYGGSGNDTISGDEDASLGGDDYVNGEDGDDVLFGGAGSDALIGGAGNDEIQADDSSDPTELQGDDYLDGGAGEDSLFGGGGADTLLGGADNDYLEGDMANLPAQAHGDDYLDGGDGDDTAVGSGGADTIYGGVGNDRLHGDSSDTPLAAQGDDYLDGGAGDDQLTGYGGNDELIGGAGDDRLWGDLSEAAPGGDDWLDGGDGADIMLGYGGNDELIGGAGNDSMSGGAGNDELDGGDGNDTIQGGDGNDVLLGGLGADVLVGGAGDDVYVFTAEDLTVTTDGLFDAVIDSEGRNYLVFDSGFTLDDVTLFRWGTSSLILSTDSLRLEVDNGLGGSITGFAFADGSSVSAFQLIGSRFNGFASYSSDFDNVTLIGGALDDTIAGLGNNATISGGRGDDALSGGLGATTYHFDRGDGLDTIDDLSTFAQSGNANTLVFGSEITRADVTLSFQAGSSQLVIGLGNYDQIVLNDFSSTDVSNGPRTLDRFQFDDGTILDWSQLVSAGPITVTNFAGLANVSGTNLSDVLMGSSVSESIDGGAGDDILFGGAGIDTLSGGAGNDTYVFELGTGVDIINNTGADAQSIDRLQIDVRIDPETVSFYRVGNSLLVRVAGTSDEVTVTDYFGTAGLDEIVMPNGTVYTPENVPLGSLPQNEFLYSRGDGSITFTVNDPTSSITDVLRLGSNVDPATVRVTSDRDGNLVIRFARPDGSFDSTDRVILAGGVTIAAAHLDQIVFTANPSIVWNADEILSMARLPTAGDDYVFGTAANDVLHGLDGYDFIDGGDGDDVIYGDDKGDTLQGGAGNDELWTGTGDSHTLDGGAGNDRLMIEASATAVGGAGSDTYVIENRQVRVTIDDRDTDASSIDVLQFGAGISLEDLRISAAGNVLKIQVRDRSQPAHFVLGSIDVWNFFRASSRDQVIDEIRFADSPQTVLTFNDVLARTLIGDDTNEVITGFETADVLRGNGGNDILDGLDGADDLEGGAGHDQLNGGLGDDVYRVGGDASSVDEIFDTGGVDRLEFAADVQPSNVSLYRVSSGGQVGIAPGTFADALLVVYGAGTQNLLIENFFAADDSARLEEFRFADGTVWDSVTIAANTFGATGIADTQTGTAGNDSFTVDHSSDLIAEAAGAGIDSVNASVSYVLPTHVENLTLTGVLNLQGTGNELDNTIIGNPGANRLVGGAGVDTMSGGAGDDTYWVGQSGGESFDSTYNNFQDIVVEQQDGGIDTIMAVTYSAVLPEHVERFVLVSTYGNASNFPNNANLTQQITGNALDNFIDASTATPYFDAQVRIDGGAGADVMIGNYSRNVYVIDNVGDVIVDTGGSDTVESYLDHVLGDDMEHLTLLGSVATSGTGNALDNVLTGSSLDNVLAGATGADQLFGMEGNDTLLGGDGNDTLDGGSGADIMRGGAGDDRYIVNSTDDVIVEDVGGGLDQVTSSVNYTLADGLEYLYLTGAAWRGVGNALDNRIVGNNDWNTFVGGAGDDSLEGYLGGDTYEQINATSGHDRIYDTGGSDTISLASEFNIDVENVEFVRVGNDLRIGFGANSSVTVSSWFSNSTNQIETLWLHSNADDYFQYSATQINGLINGVNTGPVANWSKEQVITLGGTTQFQLAADMFYDIESQRSLSYSVVLGDGSPLPAWISFDAQTNSFVCTPPGAEVETTVEVRVTATDEGGLSAQNTLYIHVRRPTIICTAGDDHMLGGDAPELIYGGAGNDTIEAGDGADEIYGEDGNDVIAGGLGADYIVGNAGNDTVAGDAGADTLYGNEGKDVLDGGLGADILEGGDGDDVYYVDDMGDSVFEFPGSGTDEVRSTISYTLGADVENLTLLGSATITATGNSLDNVLIGNSASNQLTGGSGNDTLDGGASNDAMSGGQGNDVYYVDHAQDTTNESSGQGTDTVRATVNWILATNVENLELLGSGNLSGTGNGSANRITGNAGDNALSGAGGADTLVGGNGSDTYSYASGHGTDTIDNVSTDAASAQDRLNFTNLTRSQVTLSRSGSDLLMSRNGSTTDSVRVLGWFTAADNQLDFVQFTNQTLSNAQINALFPAGLTSTEISESDLALEHALTRFHDAVNHFGSTANAVVDALHQPHHWRDELEWLGVDGGTRGHGGGHVAVP